MNNRNDINTITISGYLKESPKISQANANINFVSFTLMSTTISSYNENKKEHINYIPVMVFGEKNIKKSSNLKSNDTVLVIGKLKESLYRDKNDVTKQSIQVIAQEVYKINNLPLDYPTRTNHTQSTQISFIDDDIPF